MGQGVAERGVHRQTRVHRDSPVRRRMGLERRLVFHVVTRFFVFAGSQGGREGECNERVYSVVNTTCTGTPPSPPPVGCQEEYTLVSTS